MSSVNPKPATVGNARKWLAILKEKLHRSRMHRSFVLSKHWLLEACGLRSQDKQIIICGYPRAGTSLLLNMMSASLAEFRFADFERPATSLLWKSGNWVSKMPNDIFHVDEMLRENICGKELYFIIVIRDLRDVITSVHPNLPDKYYCGYESRWNPGGKYPYHPALTTKGIGSIHNAILAAEAQTAVKTIRVHYERLVTDSDQEQGRLADFLGVRFVRPFAEFHEHPDSHAYRFEGQRRPRDPSLVRENSRVDVSRIGKWRDEKHQQRICEECLAHPELFDLLRYYGYAQDNEWFHALGMSSSPR